MAENIKPKLVSVVMTFNFFYIFVSMFLLLRLFM